jgi:hypothetical protein
MPETTGKAQFWPKILAGNGPPTERIEDGDTFVAAVSTRPVAFVVHERVADCTEAALPYAAAGQTVCPICAEWMWLGPVSLTGIMIGVATPVCKRCALVAGATVEQLKFANPDLLP